MRFVRQTRLTTGRQRNGITLLFVISMIVLFLLMGTAFVLISNDFYRTAVSRNKKKLHQVNMQPLLESAFYDIVRGTDLGNTSNPLRGHSILEDMYGYGVTTTIDSAAVDSSEHFLAVTLGANATGIIDGLPQQPDQPELLPKAPGAMTGLVLSFVSGPAKGLSTRVVDHQVSGDAGSGFQHQLILMPHWSGTDLTPTVLAAVGNDRVIINGRPFSGTGAGHFVDAGSTTAALSASALQPNQLGRSREEFFGTAGDPADGYFSTLDDGTPTRQPMPNSKAPNEPYDTFDPQNMFLAGMRPVGKSDDVEVIPSFHREKLIADPTKVDLDNVRMNDFRATAEKGGSGVEGLLVDNDNDGTEDSIWIDTGAAAVSTHEGIYIKPLVSYLVLDMGSRANVNAHGSSVALEPDRAAGPNQGKRVTEYADLLDNVSETDLVPGQGFGPAEILLSEVVPGQTKNILDLRYGDDRQPGIADYRDDWSGYQLLGLPEGKYGYEAEGTVGGHYGSMLDLHGRYSEAFPEKFEYRLRKLLPTPELIPIAPPSPNDNVNSGLYDLAGAEKEESIDSPYEFSFSRDPFFGPQKDPDSDDRPFTPRELEALLRRNDADIGMVGQPSRLRDMFSSIEQKRFARLLTTHSHEIQTLYQDLPTRLYDGLKLNGLTDPQARDQLLTMLPGEVLRGLPMNVNRFFGDGVDNNGNGVVDEFGEANVIVHPDEKDPNDPAARRVFPMDESSDSQNVFMRQLYVLTLLLTEKRPWFDLDGSTVVDEGDLIAYRKRIAQWVANVVDFRDADSIMTPFECDLQPWDGWDMDSDLTSSTGAEAGLFGDGTPHRFVVWGMERPELLITETLATHDTREQDLDIEAVDGGGTGAKKSGGDADFDSQLMPKVTAFFELYNPWVLTDANQIRPGELYSSNRYGVDLKKTANDGTPVWRLVVPKVADKDLDPDAYGSTQTFDRRIYFTRPKSSVNGPGVFYPDININVGVVAPGAYAVVGTAGQQANGKFNNYFGRRISGTAVAPDPDSDPLSVNNLAHATRRISMDPTADELELVQAVSGKKDTWDPVTRKDITVVPIGLNDGGRRRDLGVSDPVNGYFDLPAINGAAVDIEEVEDGWKFMSNGDDFAYDEPVDKMANPGHYNKYIDGQYGITAATVGYRVVHLQRLANPLFPYHADLNPYRTIDSAAIDLFVYNGVEPTATRPDKVWFSSFERGTATTTNTPDLDPSLPFFDRQIALQATGQHRLLFKADLEGNVDAPQLAAANEFPGFGGENDKHFVSQNLRESLGWYNASFRRSVPIDPDADPKVIERDQSLQDPFAWLIWPNRPFVSHLELMNVPFVSSSQLPRKFGTAVNDRLVYKPETLAVEKDLGFDLLSSHYPHLLNFYADNTVDSSDWDQPGPSLHGLMDFLEVPSPFLGTESFVNPTTFEGNAHGISYGLSPPFDRISSYRSPGKVNVNTVLDPRVWNALMSKYAKAKGTLGDQVSYDDWEISRRGSGTNSEFDNPLRPAHAANYVPATPPKPADVGLFRADRLAFDPPLFDFAPDVLDKKRALDGDRAASLRYGMRNRLGNLVTNRSSVFAIWITVGFFEANPDGSLKRTPENDPAGKIQEVSADRGEARRGRAFYLVDRSVPVAFEPGKNHNVDRMILLKSTIE